MHKRSATESSIYGGIVQNPDFHEAQNLLAKVQDVKKYLESPNHLKLAMDEMEELDFANSDHIESFIETIYNAISLDITIWGTMAIFKWPKSKSSDLF